MPRKKGNDEIPPGTPSQQDEADIVAEIGAKPANDGDSGELQVDETKIREAGAVDAESIRENRRIEEMIAKKRSGKDAPFNVENLLEKYEGVIRFWPANTIDILVNRTTGTPVQWVIKSRPRSGAEFYTALMQQHGRYEEASYNVILFDTNNKQRRGSGRITLPDTRDALPSLQVQPQAVQMPQQQQISPAAPSTDPVAMMQAMFQMFRQMQQPQQPPAPAQPPQQVSAPSSDPMSQMQAMFGLFQQMQQSMQPQTAPAQPVMPPPPPPGSDPATQMEWMQRAFQLFQKTQNQSQPQFVPQPQVVPPAPAPSPPSSDPMVMMSRMFDMFLKMQQAVQPAVQPPAPTPPGQYRDPNGQYGRPYSGPPRPYDRAYGGGPGGPPPPHYERPKTAEEQFREAIGIVKMAASITDQLRPPPAPAPEPERYDDDEDNPVRVVKVGEWPILINKDDGSSRKWESVIANVPNMLKWFAEQREAIMKAAAEREAKQPQQRQPLPRGYVEVTPGYQPPPGYVAVPVEGLPSPPDESEMPPPITQQEEPPPARRTWGAPPVPGAGG